MHRSDLLYILTYVPVNMESLRVLKYTSLGKKLSRAVKSGVQEVSVSELHSDVNLVRWFMHGKQH